MPKQVFVLNGPNLNLLGTQARIYGRDTLDDVRKRAEARAAQLGLAISFRQGNHEGELIDWIQEARSAASGIILNAGVHSYLGRHSRCASGIAIAGDRVHLSIFSAARVSAISFVRVSGYRKMICWPSGVLGLNCARRDGEAIGVMVKNKNKNSDKKPKGKGLARMTAKDEAEKPSGERRLIRAQYPQ